MLEPWRSTRLGAVFQRLYGSLEGFFAWFVGFDVNPVHISEGFEPRSLALGQSTGVFLDQLGRLVQVRPSVQIFDNLSIPDGAAGLLTQRFFLLKKRLNLIDKAGGNHFPDSLVYSATGIGFFSSQADDRPILLFLRRLPLLLEA